MKTIKFGFRLPNVRGYRSFDYIRELAVQGEKLGFDSAWVSDHLLFPETYAIKIGSRFLFEGLTTLAAISASTSRLFLGTCVLLPLRNPILTASILSTIDHASKGRLFVGFGVGWYKPEFDVLGVPFHQRGKVQDEQIQAILDLWTNNRASLEGLFFKISDVTFDTTPFQNPYPRILIGGNVSYARNRIARFGGGWIPTALTTDEYRAGKSLIEHECKTNGKEHEDLLFAVDLPTSVWHDGLGHQELEFLSSWLETSEENLMERGILGIPDLAISRIKQYIEAGVQHFVFSLTPNGREDRVIKTLGEEVIPSVSRY